MEEMSSRSRRKSVAIVKRNYIGRMVVFYLCLIPITLSLYEQEVHLYWYLYIVIGVVIFPHLAYFSARQSATPEKAERRNMLVESAFAGTLLIALNFNLWPSLAYLIPAAIYIGFYTGLRFYLKAVGCIVLGLLAGGLIFGFDVKWESGLATSISSMIIIFIVTVGLVTTIKSTYERSRNKIRKNKEHLEELASKLAKYLSPQVYSQIFLGKKEVRLESYRKKLSVFFSDIQGFTALTDSMESEALSSLLNSYFDEMAHIALRHGGTIDKYMGDAIMIFFGDPESRGEKEDALASVEMALEMRDSLVRLRKQWGEQGVSKDLRIRMGINTGYCTVGNFGSEDRLDYTIVGGQVNLASRLESNADVDQILISHETFALVKDHVKCEKREEIMVKGIAYPIQTYQVIDLKKNLETLPKEIVKNNNGFSLSIDLESIGKEAAIHSLEKVIDEIKQN